MNSDPDRGDPHPWPDRGWVALGEKVGGASPGLVGVGGNLFRFTSADGLEWARDATPTLTAAELGLRSIIYPFVLRGGLGPAAGATSGAEFSSSDNSSLTLLYGCPPPPPRNRNRPPARPRVSRIDCECPGSGSNLLHMGFPHEGPSGPRTQGLDAGRRCHRSQADGGCFELFCSTSVDGGARWRHQPWAVKSFSQHPVYLFCVENH
jgi:hypothetical protein